MEPLPGSDLPRQQPSVASYTYLLPYVAALCLMLLSLFEAKRLAKLRMQLRVKSAEVKRLTASNALEGLQLRTLEAKDSAYAAGKIIIAWDPHRDRGVLSMTNLPAPPVGYSYALWVLDPSALAPVAAGVVAHSGPFATSSIGDETPGFAVTLETIPRGAEPSGAILFAVAPGS